ncbi:hypothetical protein ABH922_000208 [Rhodococcus sp. 27YEA15]|uniref:hypothetical protein n=1 Tax=Rhodococcus sp. 27YEA15 TaxID=3156259 RepID=UPI003C7B03DD
MDVRNGSIPLQRIVGANVLGDSRIELKVIVVELHEVAGAAPVGDTCPAHAGDGRITAVEGMSGGAPDRGQDHDLPG